MNVNRQHEKANQSMCTVQVKNCLQNMTAETLREAFFYQENSIFFGFHAVLLMKTFLLTYQLYYCRTDIVILTKQGDFSTSAQVKIQFTF